MNAANANGMCLGAAQVDRLHALSTTMQRTRSCHILLVLLFLVAGPCSCHSQPCASGSYWDKNTSLCEHCTFGKFSPTVGAESDATCLSCPKWQYSERGSVNASDCLAPEAPNNTGLAEMPLPRTCNATTPECLDDEDCGGAGRGACLNSTCACVSPFKGTDPNENTHVMSMLITCHDTCHTHTLHMSICVQAGVVPFAPTQAQDRPATHRATAAGTGGVVSGRQRASADLCGLAALVMIASVPEDWGETHVSSIVQLVAGRAFVRRQATACVTRVGLAQIALCSDVSQARPKTLPVLAGHARREPTKSITVKTSAPCAPADRFLKR